MYELTQIGISFMLLINTLWFAETPGPGPGPGLLHLSKFPHIVSV